MADLLSLHDLFLHEARDLYDGETRLTKALPDMAESATSVELKRAFQDHLRQTQTHVARLEQIFSICGEKVKGETCEGIKGLIKEGDDLAGEDASEAIRDAGLIASAQKVEHYEIAGYGTLRTWATYLGRGDIIELLTATLDEEKRADQRLTEIARSLNVQAAAQSMSR